jgi:anti-sigma factor RsiW
MHCKFDEHIIHLYLDGELGENARARVEDHLLVCDKCRAKYESLALLRRELASACARIKAPPHLRERISAMPANSMPTAISNFTASEKIRLLFSNARLLRTAAAAFALAAIIFMLLLPKDGDLERMTGKLARVYMEWPGDSDNLSFDSSDSGEIQKYLHSELGLAAVIPQSLDGGFNLSGVKVISMPDGRMAHIRYSDGEMGCSMFIFKETSSSNDGSRMMVISDREFEVGSSADVNFVHWHQGGTGYILCGCCRFEKLAHMAGSRI